MHRYIGLLAHNLQTVRMHEDEYVLHWQRTGRLQDPGYPALLFQSRKQTPFDNQSFSAAKAFGHLITGLRADLWPLHYNWSFFM